MSFLDTLKLELNTSFTDNGAKVFRTSESSLVDLNFAVTGLRGASPDGIWRCFTRALVEDPELAIKWLFYARDIRKGLGERRIFRVIINHLAVRYPAETSRLISLIPIYGRFDDLWSLIGTPAEDQVIIYVKAQLQQDLKSMAHQYHVSLLAKWMPSSNGTKNAQRLAFRLMKKLNWTCKEYKTNISNLRRYIDIVETRMCNNQWEIINYPKVPSKASMIYRKSFDRHDHARYAKYIQDVASGHAKINAKVLTPQDIVWEYSHGQRWNPSCGLGPKDEVLEQLWKNLSAVNLYTRKLLVVRDGSASMADSLLYKSKATALTLATSLAIYFSEHIRGEFRNKFITFSSYPQLIDLSNCNSLLNKLELTYAYDDCSDTNIEAVFDLILDTARKGKYSQDDIPSDLLILSDMQFNPSRFNWDDKLFEVISAKYQEHGYKLPRIIFWNLGDRTDTVPMIHNESGLVMCSGSSPNAIKMIMSGELDPYKALKDTLNSERYQVISDILKS